MACMDGLPFGGQASHLGAEPPHTPSHEIYQYKLFLSPTLWQGPPVSIHEFR